MKRSTLNIIPLLMCISLSTSVATAADKVRSAASDPNRMPLAGMVSKTKHDGPKTAKSLKIGVWNSAGNITTYTIGNSWNDWLLWLAFDKLREPSPYVGQAQDWLATSIDQVSDDARTWEITLRDGVKWHDGTDFTAEDVAFTFEYYREGPINRWTHHTSVLPRLEKIEVLDRLKLRITSKMPMPNFDRVTAADLPIIQKKQWQSVKNPQSFTGIAIGTGPYRLMDYKADEYYKYEANEHYWKGKPLVDELTLVMIKDPQTMFTALKTGEIDGAARSLPPELVSQWTSDPDIEIAKAPSLWGTWLDINLARAPFGNRDVRRAISLAIDPDAMLKRIMLGMGKSGIHGWPHVDSVWTRPDIKVPFDPQAASMLMDGEGFLDKDGDGWRDLPDGQPLDWSIKVASNRPLLMRAAEMASSQLKAVAINSHIVTVDPATFAGLWQTRDYDLRIMDITPHGIADQDMLFLLTMGNSKAALVKETEKDAILKRWLKADSREERLKISYELQDYQNNYPSRVMLWYPDGLFAYRWKSYDNYASSAGYGIFHKYSFLPRPDRQDVVEELDAEIKD
ncbi:ABC transporter substrate-binding protein [uncultured Cohaesibacter sp.]|uniref:ABC transporter substrate-binding protein n=1 Tax=uncultured Cohaesibacter sp. TaxID=1002546 RepID=UPI0029C8B2F6|nr:ABC transporter substrate-binding protein [uncultured Cohaesibacter sp.]